MIENARRRGTVEAVKAQPVETASRAAATLRGYIAAGQLLPGTKLGEEELAQRLSISRNTLRSAFAQLEGEGLVQRIPHRGCFVARPGAEDVREIYRIRRIVELGAVMWGHYEDSRLQRIQAIAHRALEHKEHGDVVAMAADNDAFHREIVGLTGSKTLATTMDRVMAQTRLVFKGMDAQPNFHSHYVEGNVRLAERLAGEQRDLAAQELREYLEEAERELLMHLENTVTG